MDELIDFKPRDYQLYYLGKAKEQNVIICLGTGSGKTYITIMLLKEFGIEINLNKKKAIFLTPTTPLVVQQADEIRKHTTYNVKAYYGAVSIDTWDKNSWLKEIDGKDVLVFTPDIFYKILSSKVIELNRICCLIFDEAHWAGLKRKNNGVEPTNHVYKKTMDFIVKENMHNQIRIIGTTASVVNSCLNKMHLPTCFKALEETYNARILGEFDFDPRFLAEPDICIWEYNEEIIMNNVYNKFFEMITKIDELIKENDDKDDDDYLKNILNIKGYTFERPLLKPEHFKRIIRDIYDIQVEVGVYAAYLVCLEFEKEFQMALERSNDDNLLIFIKLISIFIRVIKNAYKKTINKLSRILNKTDLILNLSSCKILRLLDIFSNYISENSSKLSCLVFVDRVLFSFAISLYLKALSESDNRFSYLKPDFFVGHNNDYLNFRFIKNSVKNFKITMNYFKEGKLNILSTTSVLEEGIDIGKCNLVIRFNECKTFREFVQSKGRARAENSYYVILYSSNEYQKLVDTFNLYSATEKYLNEKFRMSKGEDFNKAVLANEFKLVINDEFLESKTGSIINLSHAGAFLTRYLMRKGNKDYIPAFEIREIESNNFQVNLSLQGITPIDEDVTGKIYPDKKDAAKSACLEACRRLYEMGQLDDHFIPITEDQVIKNCDLINNDYTDDEFKEMNFLFAKRAKERFFFEKKISNLDFLKKFCKSKYDLYEIEFIPQDENLSDGVKLALMTQLKLNDDCLTILLYNSNNSTTIKLNLIKKDFNPTNDELKEIGKFTHSIFKSTIATLNKFEKNITFDNEKCLFKIVAINNESEIDFNSMNSIMSLFNQNDEEDQLYKDCLVKSILTNKYYKIIDEETNISPLSKLLNNDNLDFVDFFKAKYDRKIFQNQKLIKVEEVNHHLNYSINKKIGNTKNKSSLYLPKEFLVKLSTSPNNIDKKFNSIPLLIYKIKQNLILRNIQRSLDKEILNIDCEEEFLNVFKLSKDKYFNEFDQYLEIFRNNIKTSTNQNEEDDNFSSNESDNNEEIVNGSVNSLNFDGPNSNEKLNDEKILEKEYEKILDKNFTRSFKKKSKEVKVLNFNNKKIHNAIECSFLDYALILNLKESLKSFKFESIEEFTDIFTKAFGTVLKSLSTKRLEEKYKINDDYQLKKYEMAESDELKMNHNFDIWTNDQSDKHLISLPNLLKSLTTKSSDSETNLERLEYLGDSFLDLVTCALLFHSYKNAFVGDLHILKVQVISNKNLYAVSKKNRLLDFIFSDDMQIGVKWLPDGFSYHSPIPTVIRNLVTTVDSKNGFIRERLNLVNKNIYQELEPKSISDSIEALIAGILETSGIRNTCLFMKYIGIYSDKFEISENQEEWFEKYNPLDIDELKRKDRELFTTNMYIKYNFQSLESRIGYEFKNKSLLIQAFKHSSYNEFKEIPSYEKLEFLGDAVIDYLIIKYFYDDKESNFSPYKLDEIKRSLTNNDFFATLSIKYGLDNYIIQNYPALFDSIKIFRNYYEKEIRPIEGNTFVLSNTHILLNNEVKSMIIDENIEINKTLADVFESLIGAIFIDSNFSLNAVWKVFHRFMIRELDQFKITTPRTVLDQMHEFYPTAQFGESKVEDGITNVNIEIDDEVITGTGFNIKMAKVNAARILIKNYLDKKENN